MPDVGPTGVDLVILLAVAIVAWYIPGSLLQRRATRAAVRRVGAAAEALSARDRPTIRWLGSSGFQIVVADAREPFRKLALVALFAPREALLLWLLAIVRGRRDTLVARAELRERPARLLEAYRGAPSRDARIGEGWSTFDAGGLAVRGNARVDALVARALADALGADLALVRRVSFAAESPHVIVEFAGIPKRDGGTLAIELSEVARLASATRSGRR